MIDNLEDLGLQAVEELRILSQFKFVLCPIYSSGVFEIIQ